MHFYIGKIPDSSVLVITSLLLFGHILLNFEFYKRRFAQNPFLDFIHHLGLYQNKHVYKNNNNNNNDNNNNNNYNIIINIIIMIIMSTFYIYFCLFSDSGSGEITTEATPPQSKYSYKFIKKSMFWLNHPVMF